MPTLQAHFILYVRDQDASTTFYRTVLGQEPRLSVPGMTEFDVGGCVLGLMPRTGIERLLGRPSADGPMRAELYLVVEDAGRAHAAALAAGAHEVSPLLDRDWGHRAAYSLDLDGYVLAFAQLATQ